ncbi:MAG: 7TM diverse intracellular signaling domain-containing protein, partial [Chloroflexota bacterium]
MRVIAFFLLLFFFPYIGAQDRSTEAEKGVLDLRGLKDQEHFIVNLNGEWEFYWKKMLHPHDFVGGSIIPDYYGRVPSYWTDYPERTGTENNGYATYRLVVILPPEFRKPLAIDLPVFDSAYDIYIDGKYVGGNGIPGKSAEETTPGYMRNFSRIQPVSDSMQIIINVSNYHHHRGGFWLPARIGTFEDTKDRLANSWAGEWSVISLLLGFSLLFLFFFIALPKDKITIFYSILAFGLAMRPLFTNHFLISNFFDIPWNWLIKCEYIGLCLVITGLAWFARNLYPSKFAKISSLVITVACSVIFLIVVFSPVKIFSYSFLLIHPVVIVLLMYLLVKSVTGALTGNKIDMVYLFVFTLVLAG